MAEEPIPCDLLVTHGCVLTLDDERHIYADGAVAITGTRIVEVGPSKDLKARYKARRTIDAKGGVVHPGYIDGHTHSTLHLTRGAITDNPRPKGGKLGPGAYNRWTNALTDEDEATSTKMAACEMAKNGFTGFVDAATTFATDAAARAVEEVGIRATFGDPYLWDLVGGEPAAADIPRAPASEERCIELMGRELKRNKEKDGLVRGHIALYGLGSATEPLLRAAKAEADAAGVVFHQHQNFMAGDREYDLGRFGRDPLVHLAEMGVLGPNVIFTHMNVLSDDECKAVADSGMALVWQPGNYMFYAINKQAPCRMPGLWADGVSLTFGADVAKVWTYGELGYIAYLLSRSEGHYLPSESLVEMFTHGGARAFGLPNDLGVLAKGRLADLVIRSFDLADHQPNLDPVRHLALVERTKGVDHVIVNGKVVVEDRRLTQVDEDAVYAEARASARRMAERAQVPIDLAWPMV
jgi:cytosine/adenosine deaminase-related metal-dependent hydrolase